MGRNIKFEQALSKITQAEIHKIREIVDKSKKIDNEKSKWIVQIFGEKCSSSFEISVIRSDNKHGQKSWGWFDETKLLICHNGANCRWPLIPKVWDKMVSLAQEIANELNQEN